VQLAPQSQSLKVEGSQAGDLEVVLVERVGVEQVQLEEAEALISVDWEVELVEMKAEVEAEEDQARSQVPEVQLAPQSQNWRAVGSQVGDLEVVPVGWVEAEQVRLEEVEALLLQMV
jgi:hypothetical protein